MIENQFAILDYGLGNIRSISNALKAIGARSFVSRNASEIKRAAALILPGVGSFGQGMHNLKSHDLIDCIYQFSESGKPILGICLGMQILMEKSEEFGNHAGLGLIRGEVRKLPLKSTNQHRLPHISWNNIYNKDNHNWFNSIFSGVNSHDKVYFLHSFAVEPNDEKNILSLTTYGNCEFVSSVKCNNIYGYQFHPEKSGDVGLKILKNFTLIVDSNQ